MSRKNSKAKRAKDYQHRLQLEKAEEAKRKKRQENREKKRKREEEEKLQNVRFESFFFFSI